MIEPCSRGGSDLEKGRNAISDLSDYLRMNIGSIESLDTDEEKHIGIRNVRERLKMQMNAVPEISSIPGSGTEVTVRIPKTANDPLKRVIGR